MADRYPKIVHVDAQSPDLDIVRSMAAEAAAGAVLVIPTDTVYGVAVHPGSEEGLARLIAAKRRDASKPIALLIDDASRLSGWGVQSNPVLERLCETFWPGALTIVCDTESGSEGFRVPAHPVARMLIHEAGGALRVSSANISGRSPARSAAEAIAAFQDRIDLVLDCGSLREIPASSVVRLQAEGVSVIREGAVTLAQLKDVIGAEGVSLAR